MSNNGGKLSLGGKKVLGQVKAIFGEAIGDEDLKAKGEKLTLESDVKHIKISSEGIVHNPAGKQPRFIFAARE